MEIDGLRYLRKSRLADLNLVHTKRQALQSQSALVIGAEDAPVLICLADNLNRGFHRETRRIRHPEPQLAAAGLANKKIRNKRRRKRQISS